MSKLRKRKVSQLAATFVVTTMGIGLAGCADTPPPKPKAKPDCHLHESSRQDHCHEKGGEVHRHDEPRIAVNPPPPPPQPIVNPARPPKAD